MASLSSLPRCAHLWGGNPEYFSWPFTRVFRPHAGALRVYETYLHIHTRLHTYTSSETWSSTCQLIFLLTDCSTNSECNHKDSKSSGIFFGIAIWDSWRTWGRVCVPYACNFSQTLPFSVRLNVLQCFIEIIFLVASWPEENILFNMNYFNCFKWHVQEHIIAHIVRYIEFEMCSNIIAMCWGFFWSKLCSSKS